MFVRSFSPTTTSKQQASKTMSRALVMLSADNDANDNHSGTTTTMTRAEELLMRLQLQLCTPSYDTFPTSVAAPAKRCDTGGNNNFLKGCQWAPDGLCILTCSDDNRLRLFNLPDALLQDSSSGMDTQNDAALADQEDRASDRPTAAPHGQQLTPTASHVHSNDGSDDIGAEDRGVGGAASTWQPVLTAAEGELVYDYCWLPGMTSEDPSSCLFVTSCRDHPVHAWDAFTGTLIGSYRSYDHGTTSTMTRAEELLMRLQLQLCTPSYDTFPTSVAAPAKRCDTGGNNNFLKGCQWAPDGLCILTCSDDNRLRLFNLPDALLQDSSSGMDTQNDAALADQEDRASDRPTAAPHGQQLTPTASHVHSNDGSDDIGAEDRGVGGAASTWQPVLTAAEGELVYDYCWLPGMTSEDPSSCLFVTSCRDHPVHAWDAFTGTLIGSYRSYDQYDEIAAPKALAFTNDSSQLLCGHRGLLHIFDVERPGRDYTAWDLTRQHMKGVVSTLAFSNHDDRLLAAGCYGGDVALMDCSSRTIATHIRVSSGVTHVLFSPHDPHVYVGTRMDPHIWGYDVRNMARPLLGLQRGVTTNQRMYFDIDPSGQYLITGQQDGSIVCYDLWSCVSSDGPDTTITDPAYTLRRTATTAHIHTAATNGVSIHPYLPLLATASGQRMFELVGDDSDSDDEEDADEEDAEERDEEEEAEACLVPDNTLKVWRLKWDVYEQG
ncbi:hypothetical protein PTSG_12364 [Salpingoeca rosetta]|uniref:Telomerase Cajal body protein 1 n=1 Tax=Salpingoeca rosetta (strain ATCC 50818 / BSB-021) TaxID=946362 RepID=F2UCU9_SALR5|nr:uncharacterized protein PTSG_12364 [Salpingoeca rosetta]EGD74444.1 hypothetical protein PTSG_12364 [Salpingoeca rosetta]|eukprot:XP_004992701.1 hypothetical protein PTSG_12364 [Salpingoeca rosetta]